MAVAEINQPVRIAIIGGGFCGVLTAIHLLRDKSQYQHIHIINKGAVFTKGVAYAPHTASLLLNVPNGRMSALPDMPDHYVQWLGKQYPALQNVETLSAEFSTRQQYGEYLNDLWDDAVSKVDYPNRISVYNDVAEDITEEGEYLHIHLQNHMLLMVDVVILATGNEQPVLPAGLDKDLQNSSYYFNDPWKGSCIKNIKPADAILIIGNGLTMADTVAGLTENGITQTIHTISPHGYRLKPWHEEKSPYATINWNEIISYDASLLNLLKVFNYHRKKATDLDQSAYPLIDSLRPHLQKIWQGFTLKEKQQFIKYLSAYWNSIRHRLPVPMHEMIMRLQNKGRLITHVGYLTSVRESGNGLEVVLSCNGQLKQLKVQRIINCTGPAIDIGKSGNILLQNLSEKGLITPGPCGLGINAEAESGKVITAGGTQKNNLFVIGSNLKGVLWESTAVPELRLQAQKLARHISSTKNNQCVPVVETVV